MMKRKIPVLVALILTYSFFSPNARSAKLEDFLYASLVGDAFISDSHMAVRFVADDAKFQDKPIFACSQSNLAWCDRRADLVCMKFGFQQAISFVKSQEVDVQTHPQAWMPKLQEGNPDLGPIPTSELGEKPNFFSEIECIK